VPGLRSAFVIFAVLISTTAVGQNAPDQNPTPDVAILATVHAKELRFTEVPEVKVTFPGQPKNQTVWKSDRTNLPDQVQPYVTYRDIGIRLTITSTLPNIEEILNEALGTSADAEEGGTHEKENHVRRTGSGRHTAVRAAADNHKH
jgi:hypothetical protein